MSLRLLLLLPLTGCFYSIETRCHDVASTGSEVRGSEGAFDLVGDRIRLQVGTLDASFLVPKATGPTTLAALDAQSCEWNDEAEARICVPIDAPVDVAATCDPTACKWLDLTVHLPEGEAHLLHREWTEQACAREHEGSDSAFAVEL